MSKNYEGACDCKILHCDWSAIGSQLRQTFVISYMRINYCKRRRQWFAWQIVFGLTFGFARNLCSVVIADNKEESEQQISNSHEPDHLNFQKMSMKSAIGSRLIRDCSTRLSIALVHAMSTIRCDKIVMFWQVSAIKSVGHDRTLLRLMPLGLWLIRDWSRLKLPQIHLFWYYIIILVSSVHWHLLTCLNLGNSISACWLASTVP